MKRYFGERLQLYLMVVLAVDLVTIIVSRIFGWEAVFICWAFTFGFHFNLIHPSFVLLFPYSRKRIFMFLFFESIVHASVTVLNGALMYWSLHPQTSVLIPGDMLRDMGLALLGIVYARTMVPTKPQNSQQKVFVISWRTKDWVEVAIVWSCIGMLFLLRNEPWIYVIVACGLLLMPFQVGFRLLRFPPLSQVRLSKSLVVIGALIFSSIMGIAVVQAFKGPPGRDTNLALAILGSLPVPLPETRLEELIKSGQSNNNRLLRRIRPETVERIEFETWRDRTLACKSDSCLELSELIIPIFASGEERLKRLEVMFSLCKPKVIKYNVTGCSGPRLPPDSLKYWFKSMSDEQIVKWLKSEETHLQFAAIRMLIDRKTSPEALARLQELEKSANEVIRLTVNHHILHFMPCFESAATGKKPKDKCTVESPVDYF